MERLVVHVTTLDQWKSVLDVWFKQGYSWYSGGQDYFTGLFDMGHHALLLDEDNDILLPITRKREAISYEEFMSQQKEDNKMKTYYVTKKQLDLIEELKNLPCPLVAIMQKQYGMEKLYDELPLSDREWLRYLGGDETIEFKVKEPLYRLWRDEMDNDIVYMTLNNFGTPNWTMGKENAFTAPLEEIKKWKTPAWSIEEAK